ncbi:ATPase [Oceanomicrobium pacificus]|uniref:ATPase n=1 Tax=Oceanomicrobium pacificus TaxID=2692916 RepID=A0A6B0TLE5_9RHOB|nr:ATPase [Oceanomicrobium pacificus]MXU65327.1 ATPase [Oceanomicrobium pacificus]
MSEPIHTSFAPKAPVNMSDTGLEDIMMRDIMLKTMFRRNLSNVSEISRTLCVSVPIAQELIDMCRTQNLIETLGAIGASTTSELRYQLTDSGKARALDALAQSEYFGALPVPLPDYWKQTAKQAIGDAVITREKLEGAMQHLVLPEGMLDQLGPAVNSGRSVLMYGPPGNGKSSISNGIRDALGDNIYVPRFLEYGGQVISVYDPIVHTLAKGEEEDTSALRRSGAQFDQRYLLCRRPTVMTGGELTLEMLDLNYNPVSRTYQAPLQLKATGGVFIVDDLGRQSEPPQALINRWIVPMESSFDILSLQSGQKFMVPFDTLVVFSTNFAPSEMFDGAALRRIYYKIKVDNPSRDDFIKIFIKTARAFKFPPEEEVLAHLLKTKYPEVNNSFASYHAPFLIDQMLSIIDYENLERKMTIPLVDRAWENLFVDES